MTFVAVDREGAMLAVNDGPPERVGWEELRKHAQFPKGSVTTRDETTTTPAGTFECVVYVVKDSSTGETKTFYFAKRLPGEPVLFFTEKDGTRKRGCARVRGRGRGRGRARGRARALLREPRA